MQVKVLELRDEGTLIPLLCVDMNPDENVDLFEFIGGIEDQKQLEDQSVSRRYLLRRCGYPCDGLPNISITHLGCDGKPMSNDPYSWGGRTYPVAHDYIIKNWEKLKDGDVVDVQFILGETPAPKVSERYSR